nr:peptidylprolyl isomerase [uncultured Draconibacterium sp.]
MYPKKSSPFFFIIEIVFKGLFLLILFISVSCKDQKKTVLQIGTYQLTNIELKEIISSNSKNARLNRNELKQKLIEDGYILAHALENKDDTISAIKKRQEYALRLYASEVNGFVWNHKVKPLLKVTKKDVTEAYKNGNIVFKLEIMQFPNQNLINDYLQVNFKSLDLSEFSLLKKQVSGHSDIKIVGYNLSYPYRLFGTSIDSLEISHPGDVLGPIEGLDGYYVVHVLAVNKKSLGSLNEEYSRIEKELIRKLTEKYIWESQKAIYNQAKPDIKYNAIQELVSKYAEKEQKWVEVDSSLTLMEYNYHGKRLTYKVRDFFELIKYKPVFYGVLSNVFDVEIILRNYLLEIYLFDIAKDLNIKTDHEFSIFSDLFLKRILINYFKVTYIPNVDPDDTEKKAYYYKSKDRYKSFETATVSFYKFKEIQSAFAAINQIKWQLNSKSTDHPGLPKNFRGLLSVHDHVRIETADTSYNPVLMKAIGNLKKNQISSPIKVNQVFFVVYMEDMNGITSLPYKLVESEIEKILSAKIKQEILDEFLLEFKLKYPIHINLLDEYLNKYLIGSYKNRGKV